MFKAAVVKAPNLVLNHLQCMMKSACVFCCRITRMYCQELFIDCQKVCHFYYCFGFWYYAEL